jgi:N-acyl-D-amino-acid deacylase
VPVGASQKGCVRKVAMRFVLQGAEVVDGTGSPRRKADVSVVGGYIDEVAETIEPRGDFTVDVGGLVLAPGFIDPHTHFDAQVLWDRDLTPSSWHGVTTVITGNCGFGIAPTKPEHRSTIMRTLENVEGMPLDALEAGLPWTFETFPESLDAVDGAPNRLNIACLAGHTPLRFFVLGDEATEREASADEVETMRQILRHALDAGAVGFSTSRSESHRGAYGRPVPSRAASLEEIRLLASVLGECGHGTFEATWGPDLFVDEFAAIARQIERPVTWAALMTVKADPEYSVRVAREIEEAGGTVFPQISCSPIVVQLSLAEPAPLANVPAFGEILSLPQDARAALYADPQWRARARREVRERWGDKLDEATVQETERHGDLRHGPTLGQLASERDSDSLDVMVDLALEEELSTRFRIVMTNDDDDQIGELLGNPRFLLGLSDAGAHTSQLCDAGNSTTLLSHWVRQRRALTLEQAVWRMTGHPAGVYGLTGRGRIAPGWVSDLVAFDPDTVGCQETERIRDFPAGADRLVTRSVGIHHVWVNGIPIWSDGEPVPGARPGLLLRQGLNPPDRPPVGMH